MKCDGRKHSQPTHLGSRFARTQRSANQRVARACAAAVGVLAAGLAVSSAQLPPNSGPPNGVQSQTLPSDRPAKAVFWLMNEYSFGGSYTSADGGYDVSRVRATLDLILPVAERDVFGLNLFDEYSVYDFEPGAGASAFGSPWEDVQSQRISARYSHAFDTHWSAFAGGGVESSRELGGEFGESLNYAVLAGVRYDVDENLKLGLVGIARTELEEGWTFIGVPTVEWRIDEHWRTGTDLGRGPGLFLEYQTEDQQWAFALRARYESRDFRLADDNLAAPGGVGIDRRLPIYLDIDWNLSQKFSLNAMVGVIPWERLKLEDAGGVGLQESESDPLLFLNVGLSFRF